MIILHAWTTERIEDQRDTIMAIQSLRAIYGNRVISEQVHNPDGYWKFLLRYWQKDDIVNVEQDIVPTQRIINAITTCSQSACTVPYGFPDKDWSVWRGEFYTGQEDPNLPKPVFYDKDGEVQMGDLQPIAFHRYYPPFPKYVECSGLGMVKISQRLQEQIPLREYPITKHKWNYMDSWISYYMQQRLHQRWHVHTPVVQHNHYR